MSGGFRQLCLAVLCMLACPIESTFLQHDYALCYMPHQEVVVRSFDTFWSMRDSLCPAWLDMTGHHPS